MTEASQWYIIVLLKCNSIETYIIWHSLIVICFEVMPYLIKPFYLVHLITALDKTKCSTNMCIFWPKDAWKFTLWSFSFDYVLGAELKNKGVHRAANGTLSTSSDLFRQGKALSVCFRVCVAQRLSPLVYVNTFKVLCMCVFSRVGSCLCPWVFFCVCVSVGVHVHLCACACACACVHMLHLVPAGLR